MRSLLDKTTELLPKRPKIWIALWITWFVTLWLLSSTVPTLPPGPELPNFDKVAHFGYFGLGAVLLTAWLRLKHPRLTTFTIILVVTTVGASIGALDEYHQTFTPGRSGNDPFDWLADLIGSICGAFGCILLLFPQDRPQRKAPATPHTNN